MLVDGAHGIWSHLLSLIAWWSNGAWEGVQADAAVLSTLVVLQHACMMSKRKEEMPPLHVIGMVQRPETIGVANYLVGALSWHSRTKPSY